MHVKTMCKNHLQLSCRSWQDFTQSLMDVNMLTDMAVAWPMTLARWRSVKNRTHNTASLAHGQQTGSSVDCWKSMGGRPEAWYLVCCDLNWSGCWGGDFTSEMCCEQVPGGQDKRLAAEPTRLRQFLDFSDQEFALFLQALPANHSQGQSGRARFHCLSPMDCAKEAFARFYQASWDVGILPLRHPWFVDMEDHLVGLIWKMRAENRGGNPAGHEHTFERLQMAHFLKYLSSKISPQEIPAERGATQLPAQHLAWTHSRCTCR